VLFVPLVLSVRYATDVKHQETTLESGCILCETGALYQFFGHLPDKKRISGDKLKSASCFFGGFSNIFPVFIFSFFLVHGFKLS